MTTSKAPPRKKRFSKRNLLANLRELADNKKDKFGFDRNKNISQLSGTNDKNLWFEYGRWKMLLFIADDIEFGCLGTIEGNIFKDV